jgi:hypothetical protein
MSEFDHPQQRDAYFSKRIRAGKRTYYFDVKATRGNDYYLTITESKRKPGESEDRPMFEKHKIFLYKEDFEKFTDGFQEALSYIRQRRSDETPSYQSNGVDHNTVAIAAETATTNSSYSGFEFEDLGK